MKRSRPIPFKIPKSENQALLVQVDEAPYFYNQLHYHPEVQLIAIVKGEGIFYGGNTMSAFSQKDVFIVGANVPHLLKCSNIYYTDSSLGVKGVSLFFDELAFGRSFFELKEMQFAKALIQASRQVIKVTGTAGEEIFNKITSTTSVQNEKLIITFLEILLLLHQSKKEYLNSEQYNPILDKQEGGRLNDVLDFTFQNFYKEITIEQIAKIAFLSRSQFSYFFKLHTGKTYIQFLNALRIENACNLLKNEQLTIEHICFEVGFQNVSNFIRHFKKIKGVTPSQYRKSWII